MNRPTTSIRTSLALALGLGVAATWSGAIATPASATVPGTEGRIVYVAPAGVGGNWQINTIAPNGADRQVLAPHPAADKDPVWSPDGTKIAFASHRAGAHMDIWQMNADGTGLRNLTYGAETTHMGASGVEPDWSPDGTRIAYTHEGDVWTMNADTGFVKRNLTHNPSLAAAGQHPAWSPDGTTIAYIRGFDIWMMDTDGSNERQVTFSTGGLSTEKFPEWSPDGLRLVYERTGQIWTMNADGSQQTAISAGPGKGGTRPTWSPEGDYVLFSSSGYTAPNGPDLFRMRPDGTQVHRVTRSTVQDYMPSWQGLPTGQSHSTYVTVAAGVAENITATGELFNAHPGGQVRVVLQRQVGENWQYVAGQDPVLDAYGNYSTTFPIPDPTVTCRLVAKFNGDADSLASPPAYAVFPCGGAAQGVEQS